MTDCRQKARKFREYWTLVNDSEVGGYQKFWIALLADVLGAENVLERIAFQIPVPMKGTTKYLDAWIPETRVLIEHKSRGIKLDAPQSGHGGKTPYEQAIEYNQARGFSEKARWIVTCNFDEIWVYDMDKPLADPQKIRLADLPKEVSRLGFLVDSTVKSVREKEKDISIKAGRIVGELYKALLKRYGSSPAENAEGAERGDEKLAALNRLCVRLVFLFYAEDADVFPKDVFWNFLKETPAKFLRGQLQKLFRVLDTPEAKRDPYLEPELAAFPYTNGGLFKGADEAEIPPMDDEIKELLVKSANFDWRDISPTIFGALFESTLNPDTRRAGGMVYTSVENIHKVIDPLFLDDLTRRVDEATKGTEGTKGTLSVKSRSSLLSLQSLLASLTFLDPACGSGNFLTETFLSLRRLENRIIAALQKGQGELDLGLSAKVSLAQFHGIEINDFAVAVAKTAMWISEAKMRHETAKILHREPDYLPLKDYDGIVEGNALRMNWPRADYIMGNPPFSGARWMGKSQKDDMLSVFGKDWQGVGDLDYVTAWYKKAVDCVSAKKNRERTKAAFVSTNSICQGGSVINLWKPLFAQGLEIDFAWRTFRWDNESFEKAHVHCVIVGFHCGGEDSRRDAKVQRKTIFDGDKVISAAHINGYLMDGPDIFIESRTAPICVVPTIGMGNQPIDGGNYIFTAEEKSVFLKTEPRAEKHFHPWYGAEELINGKSRYCLWLGNCSPTELFAMPECLKRVEAVRAFRLLSKRTSTKKIANKPTRFQTENFPKGNYVAIPEVSSERRRYVPMGYLSSDVICSNKLRLMPDATLYHFGVLMSSVHNAWVRAVCGRLKSDYDYSIKIVYNNFPWPECLAEKDAESVRGNLQNSKTPSSESNRALRQKVELTGQSILDARAKYPDATLAQMYGDKMYLFPEIVAAHAENDKAVLAAYGLAPDTPEPEIVAHLFKLYAEMTRTEAGDRGDTSQELRHI